MTVLLAIDQLCVCVCRHFNTNHSSSIYIHINRRTVETNSLVSKDILKSIKGATLDKSTGRKTQRGPTVGEWAELGWAGLGLGGFLSVDIGTTFRLVRKSFHT
jgi:hypothetical protein